MDERAMIKAAVLHYQHDMTHEETGRALGWNRVKVTRALKEARARGLVEFVVHDPIAPFEHLERAVAQEFGLTSCRIGPALDDERRTLSSLGRMGAEALRDFLPASGTVAVAMSRALSLVVEQLEGVSRPEVKVAATTGTVARSTSDTSAALAMDLARRIGASAYTVPGPLRATRDTADALRRDPSVAAALELAAGASHLLVGVGSMHPHGGRMRDNLDDSHREALERAGAVGDIATRFFDRDGAQVRTELDDELLSLDFDRITAIPHVFVVASGIGKTASISALLSRRIITDLVVDADLARGLLDAATKERTA